MSTHTTITKIENATLESPTIAKIKNGSYTLTLPSKTATLATTADGYLTSHQSLDSCVKTSGDQTIAGVKTFSSAPVLTQIKNGLNTLEIPAKSGTLATLDDVLDNSPKSAFFAGGYPNKRTTTFDLSSYSNEQWTIAYGTNAGFLLLPRANTTAKIPLFLADNSTSLEELPAIPDGIITGGYPYAGYNGNTKEFLMIESNSNKAAILNPERTAWSVLTLPVTFTNPRVGGGDDDVGTWLIADSNNQVIVKNDHTFTLSSQSFSASYSVVNHGRYWIFQNPGAYYSSGNGSWSQLSLTANLGSSTYTYPGTYIGYASAYQDQYALIAYRVKNSHPYPWNMYVVGSWGLSKWFEDQSVYNTDLLSVSKNRNCVVAADSSRIVVSKLSKCEDNYNLLQDMGPDDLVNGRIDGNLGCVSESRGILINRFTKLMTLYELGGLWELFDDVHDIISYVKTLSSS